MRNYELETQQRTAFIRDVLQSAGASGIVFGNSGGKDSALVGILCKMACDDTVGFTLPCGSKQNYEQDISDAQAVAVQFGIACKTIDLQHTQTALVQAVGAQAKITGSALANIAPRLRMAALYAVAGSENRLVAGTDNRSEIHMGYFTKWGDGAYDFNPIADLTVTEIYEFLRYLGAPASVIDKAPSAGLYEGQTDEAEMGISYKSLDNFLLYGKTNPIEQIVIDKYHNSSAHKRKMPVIFGD